MDDKERREFEKDAKEYGIPLMLDRMGMDGLGNEVVALYKRIIALEAENERYRDYGCWANEDLEEMAERLEQAEAELAGWRKMIAQMDQLRLEQVERAEQAEAEGESWKMTAKAAGSLAESYKAELAALRERRCENCVSKGAVAYADTSHPACSCGHDARWNDLGYACNRWVDRGTE